MAKQSSLIPYAILDFAAACFFLLALSLTIVAALATINAISPGETPPVDLSGILQKLRQTPEEPALWWIYFMIFSTFLPTFVHAGLALGSMPITRISKKWRNKVIVNLRAVHDGGDSHHALVEGSWYFACQRTVTLALALGGLAVMVAILYFFLPGVGRSILYLCELLAQALGEDIIPGPVLPILKFTWA